MLVTALVVVVARPAAAQFTDTLELAGGALSLAADEGRAVIYESRIYLSGNVVVIYGGLTLTAQRIVVDYADLEHPSVTAEGDVKVEEPDGRTFTAQRVTYDLATNRGSLLDAELRFPLTVEPPLLDLLPPEDRPDHLIVRADLVERDGELFTVKGAEATTDPSPRPQWRVGLDEATARLPGGDFDDAEDPRLRGIAAEVYGFRFLKIPSIRPGATPLLPIPGFNSTYGLFGQYPFAVNLPGDATRLTFLARFGTRRAFSGRARLAWGGDWGVVDVQGQLNERRLLVLNDDVVYSAAPELGYRPPSVNVAGGLLTSRFTVGNYHEPGNDAWRFQGGAAWERSLHRGRRSNVTLGAEGFAAGYTGGDHYAWLRGSLRGEIAFDYRLYLGLEVGHYALSGATPFLFDLIEIQTDLRPEARVRFGNWLLGSRHRLDLSNGQVRDSFYTLVFRDRTLEYGLRLRTEPGFEVGVEGKLLGF